MFNYKTSDPDCKNVFIQLPRCFHLIRAVTEQPRRLPRAVRGQPCLEAPHMFQLMDPVVKNRKNAGACETLIFRVEKVTKVNFWRKMDLYKSTA